MKDKIFDSNSQVLNVFGQAHSEKEFSINTENSGVIIRSLTKNLYKDPIEGTFRELISNAVDSVRKSGNKTIQIHMPTQRINNDNSGSVVRNYMERLNAIYEKLTGNTAEEDQFTDSYSFDPLSTLIIRDFGTGIDPEIFESLYTSLFTSTKRDDSDSIGYFGLGSKSPFSMSDSFDAINFWNGKKYYYNVSLLEDSAKMVLLSVTDTVEPNGLMVCVPTRPITSYMYLIRKVLSGFSDITFEITTNSSESDDNVNWLLRENEYNKVPSVDEYSCLGTRIKYINWCTDNNIHYFYLGNVAYTLNDVDINVHVEGFNSPYTLNLFDSANYCIIDLLDSLDCPHKKRFYSKFLYDMITSVSFNISLDAILKNCDVTKVVLPPSRDSVAIHINHEDSREFFKSLVSNGFNQIVEVLDALWEGIFNGDYKDFYKFIKKHFGFIKGIDEYINNDVNFLEEITKLRSIITGYHQGSSSVGPFIDPTMRALDSMTDLSMDDFRYVAHNDTIPVKGVYEEAAEYIEFTKPIVENNFGYIYDDKFILLCALMRNGFSTDFYEKTYKIIDGEIHRIDSESLNNSFCRDLSEEIKDLDLIPVSDVTLENLEYGYYESSLIDNALVYPSNVISKAKINSSHYDDITAKLPLSNLVKEGIDELIEEHDLFTIRNFPNYYYRRAIDVLDALSINRVMKRILALHLNFSSLLSMNELRALPINDVIERKVEKTNKVSKPRSSVPNDITLTRFRSRFKESKNFPFIKRLHLDSDFFDKDRVIFLDEHNQHIFNAFDSETAYDMFAPQWIDVYSTMNTRDSNRIYKISVDGESILDISNRNLKKYTKETYRNIKSFIKEMFGTPDNIKNTLKFVTGMAIDTLIIRNLLYTESFLRASRNSSFKGINAISNGTLGEYSTRGNNIYLDHGEGVISKVIGENFIANDIEDMRYRRLANIMKSYSFYNDYTFNAMNSYLSDVINSKSVGKVRYEVNNFVSYYFPQSTSKDVPTALNKCNFNSTLFNVIQVLLERYDVLNKDIVSEVSKTVSDANLDLLLGDNFPINSECIYVHMKTLREDILKTIDEKSLSKIELKDSVVRLFVRQVLKSFQNKKEIEVNG